ncbi:hypothetical protein BaRGS_00008755 [Batillaria attramentaria]|uniref:PNPLA domain-containing protein n=1 Tax=Batillaria attramentaria TaxID=370345 RepID=A0ABD0LK39_9CAEN
MSALCASSASYIRSASPHGKSLLMNISRRDVSPHIATPCSREPRAVSGRVARLTTSCQCLGAASQSTSTAYKASSRRTRTASAHESQRQRMSKVLHEAQISNWVAGGVNNILSGLGSFAANMPQRLTEEISRIVKKGDDDDDAAQKPKKNVRKMKVLIPLSEEPARKDHPKKRPSRTDEEKEPDERRSKKQSFAKAMEETYSSVTSYYDTSAVAIKSKSVTSSAAVTKSPSKAVSSAEPESGLQEYDLEERSVSKIRPKSENRPPPGHLTAREVVSNFISYFPFWIPFSFSAAAETVKNVKKPLIKKEFVSRSALDSRTRALVMGLKAATTTTSKKIRIQELNKHLRHHPLSVALAAKEKAIPTLLKIASRTKEQSLLEEARETLALLGYVFPLKGRGIRILTMDGGGTRGLVSIECLKKLEALTGKKVYEMFDYVCGVSTGALIATMTCLFRYSLDEVERLYIEFSREMFTRSRVMGTSALLWSHSFYSSDQWETILKAELGRKQLIEFARDPRVPKMCAVSSLVNTPHMKNFLFRNYNLPPESYSKYPGSCTNEIWEVIRASTAAPGYYEDFILNNYVHLDGGVMVNNPTALAIHESRLLWPDESLQCVVSLGTGRYEPNKEVTAPRGLSLREKISKIVDSATDTEGVHNIMTDLMPPATYFRFNPYLSEELHLDEIREDKLELMQRDTQMYLRKNEYKLNKAAHTLKQIRLPHQHALDWLKSKADKWGY